MTELEKTELEKEVIKAHKVMRTPKVIKFFFNLFRQYIIEWRVAGGYYKSNKVSEDILRVSYGQLLSRGRRRDEP